MKTPTDLDLAKLFSPDLGIDPIDQLAAWKMYEAARAIVAGCGRKLRDLLPEGVAKDCLFEHLGEALPFIADAAAGRTRKGPEPVAVAVGGPTNQDVPDSPEVPPRSEGLDPNWV